MSLVTQSQKAKINRQSNEISPFGDFKYPIGDILPNWVFSSVSPLFICRDDICMEGYCLLFL